MSGEFPTLAEVMARHADWVSEGVRLCSCFWTDGSPDAQHSRLTWAKHVESEWREACIVRTVEQLAALPLNTVVVDAIGIPRTKRHGNSHMPGGWTHAGNGPLTSRELADGRDMVIAWHPGWSNR
jgi:hypothetical protein